MSTLTNGTTSFNLTLSYSHTDATFGDLTGISLSTQNGTDSGTAVSIVSANYSYNDAGQLSSVIGNATTSFTYDEGTGNQSGVDTAYGSGTVSGDIVTTDRYNASNGHLESIVTTRGATTIYEEDLTYPAPGSAHYDQISRAQITALVLSGTASITAHYYIAYGYDSQNQLTAMTAYNGVYGSTESHFTIASESFGYDSLGNRTDLNASGTANIDIMNQYLADAGSHALTYDARGNLTGTYDYAYTYDELNRMTSATPTNHASDKAVYTYDFQNNRTSETLYAWDSGMGGAGDWSTTAASVTQYLYNGQMLMAEINGLTGKMTKSYEWDPTKPNGVGGLLCITTYDTDGVTVTGRYRPVYDANANVVALTDLSTGAVVANYSYTAFGICTASGTNADVCNFRFGGMYWQANANKYYDKARDYDPVLGRFMQRDPSGENNGQNALDPYCHNDPANRLDCDGLADILTVDRENWDMNNRIWGDYVYVRFHTPGPSGHTYVSLYHWRTDIDQYTPVTDPRPGTGSEQEIELSETQKEVTKQAIEKGFEKLDHQPGLAGELARDYPKIRQGGEDVEKAMKYYKNVKIFLESNDAKERGEAYSELINMAGEETLKNVIEKVATSAGVVEAAAAIYAAVIVDSWKLGSAIGVEIARVAADAKAANAIRGAMMDEIRPGSMVFEKSAGTGMWVYLDSTGHYFVYVPKVYGAFESAWRLITREEDEHEWKPMQDLGN